MKLQRQRRWDLEDDDLPAKNVIKLADWRDFNAPEKPEENNAEPDVCDWIPSGAREKRLWRWIDCIQDSLVLKSESELKNEFDELVSRWQDETEDSSILIIRYAHPSFLRICGFGPIAIPWLLAELKENPDWWFEALTAITGENPTAPQDSFDSAVEAWLEWGRANGYNV